MTETTKREHLWKPGQSGNPNGRPKGARHRATIAAEALFDGESEALTRRCIEAALSGDPTALRLALDRILPPRRDRPVNFPLPPIQTLADVRAARASIVDAVAAGRLLASEADDLGRQLDGYVRAYEADEIEQRLAAVEAELRKEPGL